MGLFCVSPLGMYINLSGIVSSLRSLESTKDKRDSTSISSETQKYICYLTLFVHLSNPSIFLLPYNAGCKIYMDIMTEEKLSSILVANMDLITKIQVRPTCFFGFEINFYRKFHSGGICMQVRK